LAFSSIFRRMNKLAFIIIGALLPVQAVAADPWVPKSDWGGAKPLNVDKWYSAEDYPENLANAGMQGYVTIGFTVTVDGHMIDCHVVHSSGFKQLDVIPCNVLPQRARFDPARDSTGDPVTTHGTTSMNFWTEG
jgi:TonB family protein